MKLKENIQKVCHIIYNGGIDKDDFEEIIPKIEKSNRKIALAFSIVAFLLITIMMLVSFQKEGFVSSRPVYQFGIIFSLLQIGIALLAKKMHKLSYVSVYMAISVYLLYGIFIGIMTRPEEQTVTFMVMLIFVPLLFLDKPFRMCIAITFYVLMFIALAYEVKPEVIVTVDVTDALIYGLLSLISTIILYRIKFRQYVLEYKLKMASETDQLTGLPNRNSYELKVQNYAKAYTDNLFCIYVDVNELHEVNNQKGHKAGDIMLCCVADNLIKNFHKKDIYRIGGDEYIIFVADTNIKSIETKLENVRKAVEAEGYHIATGYSYCGLSNININDIIHEADAMMYRNKVKYYKEKGLELRNIKKDI